MRQHLTVVVALIVSLLAVLPARAQSVIYMQDSGGLANVDDNVRYIQYFPTECVAQWFVRVWPNQKVRQELARILPRNTMEEIADLVKKTPAPQEACVLVMNYVQASRPIDFSMSLATPLPTPPLFAERVESQNMKVIARVRPGTYVINASLLEPAKYSELTGRIEPGTIFVIGKSDPFTVQAGSLMVYWVKGVAK